MSLNFFIKVNASSVIKQIKTAKVAMINSKGFH